MTEAEFNALKPGDVIYWDIHSQVGNFYFFEPVRSYTVAAISLDGTIYPEGFRPIFKNEAIEYFYLTEKGAVIAYIKTLRRTIQACESGLQVAIAEARRLAAVTPP